MGLGVLEDYKLKHVPGTATLKDDGLAAQTHTKLSKDGIVLVPQPSDDPNDPLNWPLWRRDLITAILCLQSTFAATLSPLLAANSIVLAAWFKTANITSIALLTGYQLLGVGLAGFIFVASARVWGKRHLYLTGCIILVISCIWGGCSGHNYNSFVAARFFQGVGLAPFEALVNASVGDMYHVHERGSRMALSNMCLFGAAFGTPVIVGVMTEKLGWQWVFRILAVILAVMTPVVFFLVPETAYVRDARFNTDMAVKPLDTSSSSTLTTVNSVEKKGDAEASFVTNLRNNSDSRLEEQQPPRHGMFSKEVLGLFNGRKSDESFFKLLMRPLPLFLHPGFVFACFIQGSMIGWTVMLGVIIALVFLQPPLSFNEVQTGYMYTGAFIGSILGFAVTGLVSDWSAKLMTKWNRGIYEPEFRLVLVIPLLITGCAGLFGFGITADDLAKFGWFWPDFFLSLSIMGLVFGASASALYVCDAYRDLAVEGFTCLLIFKNLFCFGLTYCAFDWVQELGIKDLLCTTGYVQVGVCATAVPMYVFGKKLRSFFARRDPLAMVHLR